jgi:enamine deaminase RidA (YjgF/YER057c/UK114 family)
MNLEWENWLNGSEPPVRGCVHSALAKPGYRIEVQVIAAL